MPHRPRFDIVDIPEELTELAAAYREKLVELAVEQDEELLIRYLEVRSRQ